MKVALENFHSLKDKNKTVILGDMFELGNDSLKEHQSIVDLATSLDFTHIYFVGQHFYKTNSELRIFKDYDDLNSFIKNNPLKLQSILIKGSRGMRLERLLETIT